MSLLDLVAAALLIALGAVGAARYLPIAEIRPWIAARPWSREDSR